MGLPFTVVTGAVLLSDQQGQTVDMVDSDGIRMKTQSKILGKDGTSEVDTTTLLGFTRLMVDSNISSVNVPLGRDPFPDLFVKVLTAPSAVGQDLRFTLAGKTDPTGSERDIPAIDFTYTSVAGDVDNDRQFVENWVDAFNADAQSDNAFVEAEAVTGDYRTTIHITSTEFSLPGDWFERPLANDAQFFVTGDITFQLDSENSKLISRPKQVSLARDPNNPHFLGVQNVTGSVRVTASEVDQLFEEFLSNGGSSNLAINPGGGSTVFSANANPAGGQVKVIETFKVYGSDGNTKVGSNNYWGLNSPLTNGFEIRITKNGATDVFRNVKTTSDFLARLSSSPEKSSRIPSSGVDFMEAVFDFVQRNVQIRLEPGTTDKIEAVVQDNLSQIDEKFMVIEGFLEDD